MYGPKISVGPGLLAGLVLAGCATTQVQPSSDVRPSDEPALQAAAEAFYLASDPAAMRSAVQAAAAAGSHRSIHHELAHHLALFESRLGDRVDHALKALLDPDSDAVELHHRFLTRIDWTVAERLRIQTVLQRLAEEHPDPSYRALARRQLAFGYDWLGDYAARGAVERAGRLDLAVIGSFDNENGKGFDQVYPPETGIDFAASHPGSLVEVSWRKDPVRSGTTDYIDLGEILTPSQAAVAYATAAFEVAEAGDYELRVVSSEPVKVWVDGRLVFQVRPVYRYMGDQFVIPVPLEAGKHRVLLKSAQDGGAWMLSARLTGVGGADPTYTSLAPDVVTPAYDRPLAPVSVDALLEARVAHLPDGARKEVHRIEWAVLMGLRNRAVQLADAFVDAYPESLMGRYLLAGESWDHGERGVASDILARLEAEAGDELVFLRLQQARFLRQDGLDRKARELLQRAAEQHPDRADVQLRLARQYAREDWLEDRCRALEQAVALRPGWTSVQEELGDCWSDQGFSDRAAGLYRQMLSELPGAMVPTGRLQSRARRQSRWGEAIKLAERIVRARPYLSSSYRRLAETLRRAGRPEAARDALMQAIEIDPLYAENYRRLARLAYQQRRTDVAVQHWQRVLELDPEDQDTAHRLAFLAAEDKQPWEADVPDEEALGQAVVDGASIVVLPGANILAVLDHEVTHIQPDGSTQSVVTSVNRVLNDKGRDALKRTTLRGGGRLRLLHAYAVGPDGERTKVSSIRNRTARFSGLKIGSSVVLQYRIDRPPLGYLSKHVAEQWWFETPSTQMNDSRWVVWAPQGTRFHERVQGQVDRTEEARGDEVRLAYASRDKAALLVEPFMPTMSEVAANVMLSTVPSWNDYLEWEKALLVDAFRENSEVVEQTQEILQGVDSVEEKVLRIHEYLLREIRYEQDYENHIAGVKPHNASVVMKRAYGDCKDKAVLFITMARLAGVKAHYALLRTRDYGPLRQDIPMQQFNHAIVYVPAQEGYAEGRFFDPTADLLDLKTLRYDDAGTTALVIDPSTFESEWRPIPFQSPEHNRYRTRVRLNVSPSGGARGELQVDAVGTMASRLRTMARNRQQFEQQMQRWFASQYPGGQLTGLQLVEVDDLRQPLDVRADFELPTYGRREGRDLRLKNAPVFKLSGLFQLPERRYDLRLPVPVESEWVSESVIDLPAGGRVRITPPDKRIEGPCFSYTRQVSGQGRKVKWKETFIAKCERIPVEQYELHAELAEQIEQAYRDEVVIQVKAGSPRQGGGKEEPAGDGRPRAFR